ncbi:hypothetical protein EYB33_19105 [Lysinibacillus sphaericus]|uniref:hypothetical protein n=1 Tax=Lysinibacillus TaxID=400634 RepID=UPI001E482952|nr:hypothetical protein [Lysinibacillus sphaericus]UDK98247.1 hypothetical protein EYB33_19105 [Lysinibacillus sphaericus]
MATAQLYLYQKLRERFQKPYDYYLDVYLNKIAVVFNNLEEEANEMAQSHYDELGQYFDPDSHDYEDFADMAFEKGLEYYEAVSLVRYNNKLMWISTIYQFWEQQVRKFLFDEIKHSGITLLTKKGKEIEFSSFCTRGINDIKEQFRGFGRDLEKMLCWETIEELRLLANVIKHGDGGSAIELEELRPDFFISEVTENNLMKVHRTVLNEQVLNVKDSDFIKYKEALQSFWEELPERLYCVYNEI